MNIFLATGGKAIISFFDGKASYSTDCYAITTKPFVNPKFFKDRAHAPIFSPS